MQFLLTHSHEYDVSSASLKYCLDSIYQLQDVATKELNQNQLAQNLTVHNRPRVLVRLDHQTPEEQCTGQSIASCEYMQFGIALGQVQHCYTISPQTRYYQYECKCIHGSHCLNSHNAQKHAREFYSTKKRNLIKN